MPGNLEPGSTLGSYRIEKLLGKGGMGEVYLAEDTRLNRQVALKVLAEKISQDSVSLRRFRREAKSAASLHHPNVCTMHEIGEADGRAFIALEYCEGITLQQRLAKGDPLSVDEVLDIGIQIGDALEEARKKNIVHRDIKSSNILLTPRKQVKILDFGLAKQLISPDQDLTDASTVSKLTETGAILGTAAYMSPEQAMAGAVDHRSDIFSFGVVMYEMLTGKLPFSGESTAELLVAIIHKDPAGIARYNDNVPDPLIRIVNKMLQKEPGDRYQNVHEVWTDLRQLKRESASQTTLEVGRQKSAAAKLRYSAFGIVIAMAVIIAAIFFLRPVKETPKSPQVASQINSLVALPSKVYGPSEFAYLTDAVPGSISTLLGEVDNLEVKAPPTSFEVENVNGDLNRIAEAYQVATLLITSVTAEGNRLVFNVQLVDAGSRNMLWSRQFEGSQNQYNALARQAVDGIREAIRPGSVPVASQLMLAASSEAELAFQQGKYYWNRFNELHQQGDFDIAIAALKRALELDPMHAVAAALISDLYILQIEAGKPAEEMLPDAENWAQVALRINPREGTAWDQLSWIELHKTNPDGKRQLESALKAAFYSPKVTGSWNTLGMSLGQVSNTLGMTCVLEASRLDPLYLYPPINVADILNALGRPAEGLPYVDRVLGTQPEIAWGQFVRSRSLIQLNRLEEAEQMLSRLETHVREGRYPDWAFQVVRYASLLKKGNVQESEKVLKPILEMLKDPTTSSYAVSYTWEIVVPALSHQGRLEEAMGVMKLCVDRGFVPPYDLLLLNPDIQLLHNDSGFGHALEKSRLRFDGAMKVLEEAESRGQFPELLSRPLADHLKELGYVKNQ